MSGRGLLVPLHVFLEPAQGLCWPLCAVWDGDICATEAGVRSPACCLRASALCVKVTCWQVASVTFICGSKERGDNSQVALMGEHKYSRRPVIM